MTETNTGNTLVDLHAHSDEYGFVSEAIDYSTEILVGAATLHGLGGIALTNHDTFKGTSELLKAAEFNGIIGVPGIEVTCATRNEGKPQLPHMIALLPEDVALWMERKYSMRGKKPLTFRTPKDVANSVHRYGGVVIAPHPSLKGSGNSLSDHQVEGLAPYLDGVEIFSRGRHRDEDSQIVKKEDSTAIEELARRRDLATIASSDAHELQHLGYLATEITRPVKDAQDIIEAVRAGATNATVLQPMPEKIGKGALQSQWRRMKEGHHAHNKRRRATDGQRSLTQAA